MDNSVSVFDWESLSQDLSERHNNSLIHIALAEAEKLYGSAESFLLEDEVVNKRVRDQIDAAADSNLELSEKQLNRFLVSRQDSPFEELTDDLDFYYNHIYASTDNGVYRVNADKNASRRWALSPRASLISDKKAYSVRAQYGKVALGCGPEGLYELDIDAIDTYAKKKDQHVSKQPTQQVSWQFASILSASDNGAFLAGYGWEHDKHGKPHRKFERIATEEEIFGAKPSGTNTHSFGSQEKLYRVTGPTIQIRQFRQSFLEKDSDKDAFEDLGVLPVKNVFHNDIPLYAGASAFGIVIQYADKVVIAQSSGEFSVNQGSVTKTRVFPKSIHYEGHLHSILEDKLLIQVFAGDFLIPQSSKVFGIRVRPKESRRG